MADPESAAGILKVELNLHDWHAFEEKVKKYLERNEEEFKIVPKYHKPMEE